MVKSKLMHWSWCMYWAGMCFWLLSMRAVDRWSHCGKCGWYELLLNCGWSIYLMMIGEKFLKYDLLAWMYEGMNNLLFKLHGLDYSFLHKWEIVVIDVKIWICCLALLKCITADHWGSVIDRRVWIYLDSVKVAGGVVF